MNAYKVLIGLMVLTGMFLIPFIALACWIF
jgi:hypothetical protein